MSLDPNKKSAAGDTKYSLSKYQDVKVSQVMGNAISPSGGQGGPPDIIRSNSRQNSRQFSNSQYPENNQNMNLPAQKNDGSKSPRGDGRRGILKGGEVSPRGVGKAPISKSYAGPAGNEPGMRKSFANLVREKGLVHQNQNDGGELTKSRQQSAFSNLVTKILNDPSSKNKLDQDRYNGGNDQYGGNDGYDNNRYPPNDPYYNDRDYQDRQGGGYNNYDRRRGPDNYPPRSGPQDNRDGGYGGRPRGNNPQDRYDNRGAPYGNNYNNNGNPMDRMNDRSMNNPYDSADKRSKVNDRYPDRGPGADRQPPVGNQQPKGRPGNQDRVGGYPAGGYPPQDRGGVPPRDGPGNQYERGYTPEKGYGPDRGYPPRDAQYPSRDGQYPPRDAYPPREGQYPPRDGQYPPRDGQYPPRDPAGYGDRSRSPYGRGAQDPPGNYNSRGGTPTDPNYPPGNNYPPRRGGPNDPPAYGQQPYSRGRNQVGGAANQSDPTGGRYGNRYASPDGYPNQYPPEGERRGNSAEPLPRKSAALGGPPG
jgi:hypothetical protein